MDEVVGLCHCLMGMFSIYIVYSPQVWSIDKVVVYEIRG